MYFSALKRKKNSFMQLIYKMFTLEMQWKPDKQ